MIFLLLYVVVSFFGSAIVFRVTEDWTPSFLWTIFWPVVGVTWPLLFVWRKIAKY